MSINALKKPAAVLAALSMLAGAAHADDAGKDEFMQACAACHGESGVGDGPLAELMTVPVPNLTTLAQSNDGVFPMLEVIHVIDGRTGVRGHGYPMPVWGSRFKSEVVESMGEYGAEMVVRGRVLSIAYYLESIQQK
ncbi:c-type cytochrome [Actibacterium sp. MT2.3-13A]|uniref:c-type cytochrome n=1 Tax=Actibacterium sp. MT2.3-13A TaxID=2828332 RepID=UPI001BA767AE|nr:c-type cytochrome [Actibacterium sp. MT2.3-13A]